MSELKLEIFGFENMTYYGDSFKNLYTNFIDVYKEYFQNKPDRVIFSALLNKTHKLGIYPLDLTNDYNLEHFYQSVAKNPGLELSDEEWFDILSITVGDTYHIDEFGIDSKGSEFQISEVVGKEEKIIDSFSSFDADGNYFDNNKKSENNIEALRRKI